MSNAFYATSTAAWGAMLTAIDRAKKSIYLEMYIFEDHTDGYDFVSALEQRARDGLRVIVILDAFGSIGLAMDTALRLRAAGVEVLFYRYWFKRTHRKLLIVDETQAFVGGVNISPRYAKWGDLVLRVKGRVIPAMVRSFARVYHACGGTDPALTEHSRRTALAKTRMWFIEHGVGDKEYALHRYYRESIDAARSSVVLVTPYFMPSPWLVRALSRALMRGVTLEILLPLEAEYRTIGRLTFYYAAIFAKKGAVLYFNRAMNHAKAIIIDGKKALVGSQNIDTLSFHRNMESSIFFEDEAMLADLEEIIASWKRASVPYEEARPETRWYDRLLVQLLRFFEPVL